MTPVESGPAAGAMRLLVTNEGPHSAHAWATTTAEQLVEIDATMPPDRRTEAVALRRRIGRTIEELFHEVKADSTAAALAAIASSATGRIVDLSKGSPWETNFAATPIRLAIEQTLIRNLHTAADIALQTE